MSCSEELLTNVRAYLQRVRIADAYTAVRKTECSFTFDTTESPDGIYTNLSTFQSYGREHLALDFGKNGFGLYLQQQWTRVPKQDAKPVAGVEDNALVLNLADRFEYAKTNTLVVMPGMDRVPLPCPDLPELVLNSIKAVLDHDDSDRAAQVDSMAMEDPPKESKYAADLAFADNGVKVSPDSSTWACAESGMKENLWLNLSDGHIGSGRSQWDGSGGKDGALNHFKQEQANGNFYPLVVKLGTITAAGADVYSYAPDEDDLVVDPQLSDHLIRRGINMMKSVKTEKSMAELTLDANDTLELGKVLEEGKQLQAVTGPGMVGMDNLGNTCYMNSVVQMLATCPELQEKYFGAGGDARDALFASLPAGANAAEDFPCMMGKLLTGLLTDKYARPAEELVQKTVEQAAAEGGPDSDDTSFLRPDVCVKPRAFKALVGAGHVEFSTGKQQDSAEYFQHLLEFVARSERKDAARLSDPAWLVAAAGGEAASASFPNLFKFTLEERKQCLQSGKVSYKTTQGENLLALDIPLEAATNAAEVAQYEERESNKRQKLKEDPSFKSELDGQKAEDPVPASVPFQACLDRFVADGMLDDYMSSATGVKGQAATSVRLATFPPYLMVQMKKYTQAEDWTPKKLDVTVDLPDQLDLEALRGNGLRAGEEELPDSGDQTEPSGGGGGAGQAAPPSGPPLPDESLVQQLMGMGFTENGCKRAAVAMNNAPADVTMNWIFEHMEDPDFNEPLPPPAPAAAAASAAPATGAEADPEVVMMLTSMGFSDVNAKAALKACDNNGDRAAEWLFSHADDMDAAVAALDAAAAAVPAQADLNAVGGSQMLDGPAKYTLVGFITHLGKSTFSGHYVCHIKKDGRWLIFNDKNVAVSEVAPRGHGYMYLYKRNAV